jgi:1-deoxy-D-xylulose-5-phosphate synthase
VVLASRRADVVAMTAAMPGSTGLLPLARLDPDRVIDVGIAEQHAVTAAAGLAHAGSVPILALYSTFLARAFDQLNLDVGLHGEHVIIVLDRAGITGDDGPSHHGILDMALALRVPGASVLAPSCEEDLVALLDAAVELTGPVLLRFPKGAVVQRSALGPRSSDVVAPLASRTLRDGDDVCILAVGDRVGAALAAAEQLAEDGITAAVHDVRSVRPLDPKLVERAAHAAFVVTVENGVVDGGAGTEVAARMRELVGPHRMPPVLHLGVPTTFIPHGDAGRIIANLGLDAAGIAGSISRALAAAGSPTPPPPGVTWP